MAVVPTAAANPVDVRNLGSTDDKRLTSDGDMRGNRLRAPREGSEAGDHHLPDAGSSSPPKPFESVGGRVVAAISTFTRAAAEVALCCRKLELPLVCNADIGRTVLLQRLVRTRYSTKKLQNAKLAINRLLGWPKLVPNFAPR
ncbi:unnamed protein product [Heligmosomoides polygyrus]|uniref:DEDD_Tnp_IS110 domain-containing protein n=1 Tax=Heligmosomoides polygyrus TaxID=6339 RepID=A0A183GBY1_HELPZ|nr:unnamed protein product [Heligmosomoides polygyrus]